MTSTYTATAAITPTPPLSVGQFIPSDTPRPGVGLCLSGGGSRACCAAMGQLRALSHLQLNGASLLSQVTALSCVSGGSWLGVPYAFLPADGTSDRDFLGVYNANQSALNPIDLGDIAPGNAGYAMTSEMFSVEGIALTALELYALSRWEDPANPLPANLLWQVVIASHILHPQQLASSGENYAPNDTFTANEASLARIRENNPALANTTTYTFASGAGRTQRPFLICNMGMLQNPSAAADAPLIPVQATGFFGGVVGHPDATDANELPVGGGGIETFAVNSIFLGSRNNQALVGQKRPWSLTDIMGCSSAAFAFYVHEKIKEWQNDRTKFHTDLALRNPHLHQWIDQHLPARHQAQARLLANGHPDLEAALQALSSLDDLIPAYDSWPVASPAANLAVNRYADGGSLENTGVASMLAYSDIQRVIACVNSMTALAVADYGIPDGSGGWLPGTQIKVDDQIPPLFGFMPYSSTGSKDQWGYVPYQDAGPQANPQFSKNQVFKSSDFAGFLTGIQQAVGKASSPNGPAIFQQRLDVVENPWFGVQARSVPVTVVWVYLNGSGEWEAQFDGHWLMQALIAWEKESSSFPNFNTTGTHLSARQVNLLAHLTSWSVVTAEQKSGIFSQLFR
ncbi:hypothetical protein OU995_19210 [Roseateles sp. SL47]|uniref:hypothetical protein n=1 Tax=Roseateles sp. SL47 TaxID=2995138 RepID=UPI0022720482|nr:hypothetical protein [Roseateles sp. SL47]WAC71699.1 hypothetical protein OU995_19210 [Roseateles sp. SL47]